MPAMSLAGRSAAHASADGVGTTTLAVPASPQQSLKIVGSTRRQERSSGAAPAFVATSEKETAGVALAFTSPGRKAE